MKTRLTILIATLSVTFTLLVMLEGMLLAAGGVDSVYLPAVYQWKICHVPGDFFPTIQSALDDPNCDKVIVGSGQFTERISITHDVEIIGAGPEVTILDAQYKGNAVYISPDLQVELSHLAIINGIGEKAALNNTGSHVQLSNLIIRDNVTQGDSFYIAVISNQGTMTITNSLIFHNDLQVDSALFDNRVVASLYNTTIFDNQEGQFTSTVDGGLINIVDSTFNDEGQLNFISRGSNIENSLIQGGRTVLLGGTEQTTITDSQFKEGILVVGGENVVISRTVFSGTINNVALLIGGDAILVDSTISNNGQLGEDHGAIEISQGHLEIVRTEISHNLAGGILVGSEATLVTRDTLISDNGGYAVLSRYGNSFLINSTIKNTFSCTALFPVESLSLLIFQGTIDLDNSTISENNCAIGVQLSDKSEAFIHQTTFHENAGIGLLTEGTGRIVYVNNIFSAFGDSVCGLDSNLISLGYNLFTDNSCPLNGPGDIMNTNPWLGPLQDNGGHTWTHALLDFRSPAVDAGTDEFCELTDQRGVTRPQDGNYDGLAVCDIGAFELD